MKEGITEQVATLLFDNANNVVSLVNLPQGIYQITPAGLLLSASSNYSISYVNGALTMPINVALSTTATQPLCYNDKGSVTLNPTGGTTPYTLSGDATTALNSGTYHYMVTDANGCTAIASATINAPSQLILTALPTQPLCNLQTGSVTLSAIGGTGAYSYSGDLVSGLISGAYNYHVSDANNCTANVSVLISPINPVATFYLDSDGDGYGDIAHAIQSCNISPSLGYSINSFDCNDALFSISPAVAEICGDLIDNNCDGFIDEGCGCLNPPTASAGINKTVCVGNTVSLNGSIGGSASNATWSSSGTGSFSPSIANLNATYIPSANDYANGSVILTLVTNASPPCVAASKSILITFQSLPINIGAITGPTLLCNPSAATTATYSIASIGAPSYVWSVPPGVIIVSGQGSTNLVVKFNTAIIQIGIGGIISVIPSNNNGCGTPSTLAISAQSTTPVKPGSISGPIKACPGDDGVYSIGIVARAISYTWTLPVGVSFTSNENSNIINVHFDNSFTGGTITVSATNGCGASPVRTRLVNLNILNAPTAISGIASGVCGTTIPYSITPVNGASSYIWTAPSGSHFVGLNNGINTTVDYTGTFTGGAMTVSAINGCGNGSTRSITILGAPSTPVVINGPLSICASNAAGATSYNISTVTGSLSYNWTVTRGLHIATGLGTKNVNIYGAVPTNTQTLTVRASNACGQSGIRILDNIAVVTCPRLSDGKSTLDLAAYPIPTSNKIYVSFNANTVDNYVLKITDVAGRNMLVQSAISLEGINISELDLNQLVSGIYLLTLETENEGISVMRVMVK